LRAAAIPGIPSSKRSPHEDRAPLSRPPAPLQLSTGVRRRTARALVATAFTDAHAFTRLPGSLRCLCAPFPHAETRFLVALEPERKTVPFHLLHLLRSLIPSVSPFCTDPSCPEPAVVAFPSFRPSSAFSSCTSESLPARTASDPNSRLTPRGATSDLQSGDPVDKVSKSQIE